MKITFHKNLYRAGIPKARVPVICRKIRKGAPKIALFLITLPIGNEGILEIYWYPELRQRVYQELETELLVVGLAATRRQAYRLIVKIIEDVGVRDSRIPVEAFFKEQAEC